MYAISVWAGRHKWASRIFIIGLYILLNGIGFWLGDLLHANNITLSASFFYAAAVLYLAGVIFYPAAHRRQEYRHFYAVRKVADVALVTATSLLIIWTSNNSSSITFSATESYAAATKPLKQESKTLLLKKVFSLKNPLLKAVPYFNENSKAFKKLKANIHTLRKAYKETSKGGKVALIALAVIVLLASLYLLAALSCSISCSGSDGLAILVGVLGTALLVFLFVKVIKRINNGPRHPKPEPTITQATF